MELQYKEKNITERFGQPYLKKINPDLTVIDNRMRTNRRYDVSSMGSGIRRTAPNATAMGSI